jgi:hypothetical protein
MVQFETHCSIHPTETSTAAERHTAPTWGAATEKGKNLSAYMYNLLNKVTCEQNEVQYNNCPTGQTAALSMFVATSNVFFNRKS